MNMIEKSAMAGIKRALKAIEPQSQAELARRLDCDRSHVHRMLKNGRVSAEMAVKLEEATGGQVARAVFRKDLFS